MAHKANEQYVKCRICQQGFRMPSYLRQHLRKVHRPKVIVKAECGNCGQTFRRKRVPQRHVDACQKVDVTQVCEQCGLQLSSPKALSRHIMTHLNEFPFSCDQCPKRFKAKFRLSVHKKVHTGVKSHICNHCGRGFARSTTLMDHVRTHTKERPYICVICQKGFTQKSALNTHRAQHSTNKPYGCEQCPAVFATRLSMKKHKCIVTI